MANKRQKRRRLIEVVASRTTFGEATRVLMFIACWGIATKGLGHVPVNIEEYAKYWEQSRAQAFRDQQLFRRVLPEQDTPTAICEWIAAQDPTVFNDEPAVAVWRVGALG